MKIKAIAGLCKKAKTIVLHYDEEKEVQWLGDGYASYPLLNLPWLVEENIFAMFDVPEDKQSKFDISSKPITALFDSTTKTESAIESCKISIIAHDCELLPLQTSLGLVFINAAYLKPVSDMELLDFYERIMEDGKIIIAVKCGLFLVGLIKPYDIIREGFIEGLENLTAQCKTALHNQTTPSDEMED